MNEAFSETARLALSAESVIHLEDIQSLWSGYGKIMRYAVKGTDKPTIVIKHVKLPDNSRHPRGWNTDISHQRKIRSYHVESSWYRHWASQCDETCRVPDCYALEEKDDEFMMVLEDLDSTGYALRKKTVSLAEMQSCLDWLANFHATFIQQKPEGLWPSGTYWHLATRPDELEALDDSALKAAAYAIDEKLNTAKYQTFVHGDAKLANFCFSRNSEQVAAVDFQYVGGGCGMKDVAYFIGSCLYEEDCERLESTLLGHYFHSLHDALEKRGKTINHDELESEWRMLYAFAWTDFHRFVKGWSPGHWKIHGYSERLSRQVIQQLPGTFS